MINKQARLLTMCSVFSAKDKGKHIREYLKDEGHKELLLRYDLDQEEKEKATGEEKEPSPRKLRSKDPKPEVLGSFLL